MTLLRVLRFALSAVSLLAAFLTGVGLLTAASLKNDRLANTLLNHYPRHSLAMDGFRVLQGFSQTVREGDKDVPVGVLSITDPPWPALLTFVQSETAIRKSERNEPGAVAPPPPAPSASSPAVPPAPVPAPNPTVQPVPPRLPEINYDRIKTIVSVRVDTISAGTKPLVPPYRLLVIWPPPIPRRVYEFISFEEFRLDLRRVMIEEIEAWALWTSALAFACGLPTVVLRWLVGAAERRKAITRAFIDTAASNEPIHPTAADGRG